jgi:molybdenum cofactor synthesis domain-containing protein
MLKKIQLAQAVGTQLAHDITEIRPGEFKGPAFRKGHTVCAEDVCRLQRLGKNQLYVIDLSPDEIHEDQAAALLATALAGDGVVWQDAPREGKIELRAGRDGLFRVDTTALAAFNLIDEVMCATLHNHTRVAQGEMVAATRAIPLVMPRAAIARAAAVAGQNGPLLSVAPLRSARAGIVVTGNEVYQGLIEDRFVPILTEKLGGLGSAVVAATCVPDDAERIAAALLHQMDQGCDLLLTTAGMSVDPDDVTRQGIRRAGATEMHYGAAALPGAMFLVAYIGEIPLLGVPACGLHHKTTALDLILPRVLAGERVGKKDLAFLGHGGLCRQCPACTYPRCTFGKGA